MPVSSINLCTFPHAGAARARAREDLEPPSRKDLSLVDSSAMTVLKRPSVTEILSQPGDLLVIRGIDVCRLPGKDFYTPFRRAGDTGAGKAKAPFQDLLRPCAHGHPERREDKRRKGVRLLFFQALKGAERR